MDKREYAKIHYWVRNKFGTANRCSNTDCPKKSKTFDWALIKGKEHKRKKGHYKMLCRSCHIKYDMNEQRKNRMIYITHTPDANKNRSISLKGYKRTRKNKKNISTARRKLVDKYEYKGKNLTITEWSKRTKIPFYTLYARIVHYKWNIDRALQTKVKDGETRGKYERKKQTIDNIKKLTEKDDCGGNLNEPYKAGIEGCPWITN